MPMLPCCPCPDRPTSAPTPSTAPWVPPPLPCPLPALCVPLFRPLEAKTETGLLSPLWIMLVPDPNPKIL
jgi:hypothetical protein